MNALMLCFMNAEKLCVAFISQTNNLSHNKTTQSEGKLQTKGSGDSKLGCNMFVVFTGEQARCMVPMGEDTQTSYT